MKGTSQTALIIGLSILLTSTLWLSNGFAVENSECYECHSDEELSRPESESHTKSRISEQLYIDKERFHKSVHNINEVACVDCHTGIEELNWDNEIPHDAVLPPVACPDCHEEEGEAFKNSVHMEIRGKGITMQCYACHGYHYVKHLEGASVAERENEFCLKCHNPDNFHDWLPQKKAHFAFVECTVCHAPNDSQQHIHLNFFDLVTNKFYSGQEILEVLDIEADGFMPLIDTNKDGIINRYEFEDLLLILRLKNVRAMFHAELVSDLQPIIHHVERGKAEKNCEKCHAPNSPFFNAITIVLSKEDGKVDHYEVERTVLESYSLSHFYALGGTRIQWLDKVGVIILTGGACVVFSHLLVRILTIPLRRHNDEDED